MFDQNIQTMKSFRFLIFTVLFLCGTCSAMKLAPTLRLNSGYDMPIVGLGTFNGFENTGEVERAVKEAIDSGYRSIDTAFLYGNEDQVGRGVRAKIAEGVIKREDMFIITKLWSTFHEPDQVERAFQKSFDNLNLTYIDLFLMHSPIAYKRFSKTNSSPEPASIDDVDLFPVDASGKSKRADVDYLDTWRAMEKLVKSGKVRSIGVSNFNSEQVERVCQNAEIKPVANEVECHPNLNQRKMIKFLADRNISLIAYSPLGKANFANKALAISNQQVKNIADKYAKTPAQVVLRYTIQNGAVVIPKSTNKDRIKANIDLFDFTLTDADMQIMHGLNDNTRLSPFAQDADDKYYPFKAEF